MRIAIECDDHEDLINSGGTGRTVHMLWLCKKCLTVPHADSIGCIGLVIVPKQDQVEMMMAGGGRVVIIETPKSPPSLHAG